MIDLSGKVFVVTGGNGGIGLGMRGHRDGRWLARDLGAQREQERDGGGPPDRTRGRARRRSCATSPTRGRSSLRWPRRSKRSDASTGCSRTPGGVVPVRPSSISRWRSGGSVMSVNLDGVFVTLREAAKHLIAQGEGGSLVAVSSTSAIHGAAGKRGVRHREDRPQRTGARTRRRFGAPSDPGELAPARLDDHRARERRLRERQVPRRDGFVARRFGAGPSRASSARSAPSSPTRRRRTTRDKRCASTAGTPSS